MESGTTPTPTLRLRVDGAEIAFPDDGSSLLEVLRARVACRSVKDGCSPQGQCGCCTVWVDGAPRVACVTPARRVAGREVTTFDGLAPDVRDRWVGAFLSCGASQCGFCTPGIIMRLAALGDRRDAADEPAVGRALAAHLCRCTGWQTIVEAARAVYAVDSAVSSPQVDTRSAVERRPNRDLAAASRRATLETGSSQVVGPAVIGGGAGFADDTSPADALVAVPDGSGGWEVAETLAEAQARRGRVPGRNSTVAVRQPVAAPPGPWTLELRTAFVEPAYLEIDASWCAPGGEPATPLANGGAFGGKVTSPVAAVARHLADRYGRAVRVQLSREDLVRQGPKRPPIAAGLRADGTGVMRVARTPGAVGLERWEQAVRSVAPGLLVERVDVAGPPVSADLRAAGWAEAAVMLAALRARQAGAAPDRCGGGAGGSGGAGATVTSSEGATASARIAADGSVSVTVAAGDPLDEVVLRSFVVGATHQALGWVRTEGIAVDESGTVHDLTIRSFGIIPARAMPVVDVVIEDDRRAPMRAGDTVFAAVAAATWLAAGLPPTWPVDGGMT